MKNKRAQTGIEFIVIVGSLMFFTSLFLLAIQKNTSEQTYKKDNILIKDIVSIVKNEIDLAMQSSDGYSREFNLPSKAGNWNYDIEIDEKVVYIKTIPPKYALAIPIQEVVGDINKTYNKIRKTSGVVYLNQ